MFVNATFICETIFMRHRMPAKKRVKKKAKRTVKKAAKMKVVKKSPFRWVVLILSIFVLAALVWALQREGTMILFMGVFLSVIALLKIADLKGFAHAFMMYDIVAVKSKAYAYIYPFIEAAIGIAFLATWQITAAAWVLLVIMAVGSIGVIRNLTSKSPVKCACLGTLINLPLTKFTLFEDLTMVVMSLMILFF